MLQNAYLLAKIGADTAENERNLAENLPKNGNYPTDPLPYRGRTRALDERLRRRGRPDDRAELRGVRERLFWTLGELANLAKLAKF